MTMVCRRETLQHLVVVNLSGLAIERVGNGRNQHQRSEHRADKGIPHRERHRRKQFALNALESKQGHIGDDDDEGGEEDRFSHCRHTFHCRLAFEHLRRSVLTQADNRFHHHDRPVHKDTEVDGSERKQVGGYIGEVHQDKRHKQRYRNGNRH